MSESAPGLTLCLFARLPQPGQVKSRLAADLGLDAAAEFYQCCLHDVIDVARTVEGRRLLAYTPPTADAAKYFRSLAGMDFTLWPQPSGDLGDRLCACFEQAFAAGADRVIVIGTDAPSLPVQFLHEAHQQLREHDVVLGPALDGGYVLIGLQRPPAGGNAWRELFAGISWSGPSVLAQTMARAAAAGLSPGLLPPWYDVDTRADLRLLRAHVQAMEQTGAACICPRTAAWLTGREF